jgi:release factor glutamine methyltransferase
MSTPPTVVGVALARAVDRIEASGPESPRLDAEILLAWILGVDRSILLAHPEAPLSDGHVERFHAALDRREAGEPIAYIRGMKEFYGSIISVDPRVLIPRPETEALVGIAVDRIRRDLTETIRPDDVGPYTVWDIGTGSGAIAIAIANDLRRRRYDDAVRFHLSDASDDALAVALVNVVSHGLADRLTLAKGPLDDALSRPEGRVHMVVANLPYIPTSALDDLPVAVRFEPAQALDGGADGLDLIRGLLPRLPVFVRAGGVALLEIGSDQVLGVEAAASEHIRDWSMTVLPDLSGAARVVQLDAPA